MAYVIDLAGRTFTRLTVISRATNNKHGQTRWMCRCACGSVRVYDGRDLRSGDSKSCGCFKHDGISHKTHGMRDSSEYSIWTNIKSRCYNQRASYFSDYGGRGIAMCDRWRDSFEAFYADMGQRPSPKHSIERRNNDGPYSPHNCYWALKIEQANNTRSNRWLTFQGDTKTLSQWSRALRMNYGTLYGRLRKHHWNIERALTTPLRQWPSQQRASQ
jgi:hypothetical protein